MKVCPIDLEPCCDDICHGAGCVQCDEPMLEECHLCGEIIEEGECGCEPDGCERCPHGVALESYDGCKECDPTPSPTGGK